LVEIRCGFADMAGREAEAAESRFQEARAACDRRLKSLASAQASLDLKGAQTAKEQAHKAFRTLIGAAHSRSQVEMAAAGWLKEINRVNQEVRTTQHRIQHERQAAEKQLNELSDLITAAETARAAANEAEAACAAARAALAEAGPDEVAATPSPVAAPAGVTASPAPAVAAAQEPPVRRAAATKAALLAAARAAAAAASTQEGAPAAPPAATGNQPAPAAAPSAPNAPAGPAEPVGDGLIVDLKSPHSQVIVRLIGRDTATLGRLIERLSEGNASGRRHWQLLLSDLVDAITAAAIDDGWFVFPPDHSFWGLFSRREARDVARGLAALGFRYDGLGEFANDRIPTQRDLALAVGQAGLLPVRIRHWPRPEETAELFKDVQVASEVFIASRAPTLMLGELVQLLGRRAEGLTELWNEWPQVRPLLFSTSGG
jgi:hypothetical protein